MRNAVLLTPIFLFASLLFGQIRNSTITGSIADPTGAPVPGAEVILTETQTNATYNFVTTESGEYNFPYLPVGKYVVSVRKPGFKNSRTEGAELTTSQTIRLDIKLQVGDVESTVTIEASAAELQTESARIVNRVDERTIRSIPNINNNPLNFATLQPGVVGRASMNDTQSPNSFGIGVEGRRTTSNISVNGGTAFSNDIQLDGVSVQSVSWNEVGMVPNTEAISEVKTNINNMSAEYGRSQGTVVFTTKSGTNQYRGSAQVRLRNEALNANSFSNNAQGIARPNFKAQNYAATFGGPVRIPKLYDGKDRTFFFFAYEGLRFNQLVQYQRTVPTAAERVGDFSASRANVSGQFLPFQIFDPFSVTRLPNGNFTRTQFPGNVMPRNRLDPGTLKLVSEYPLPNQTPQDPTGINNFFNAMTRTYDKNNVNVRFDHRFGSKNTFYFTYGTNTGTINNPNGWGEGSRGFTQQGGFLGATVSDRNFYAALGDTWILDPTLIADFRLGVTRIRTQNLAPVFEDLNYGDFGIPSSFNSAVGIPGMMPEINGLTLWSGLYNTAYLGKQEFQTNWALNGSVTKTRGRWTHKFGAEYRNALANYTDARGSFNIISQAFYTGGQQFGADGSGAQAVLADRAGHGGASMLLGAGIMQAGENAVRLALSVPYAALFTQNDWRVNNRLSVNIGLRWDWQPAPSERFNRVSSFSYGGSTFGSPGRLIFPGVTPGVGKRLYETSYRDFQPRVGLAYQVTPTFVVRSGFGINFLPTNSGYYGGPYYYGVQNFAPNTISQPYGTAPAGSLVGNFVNVTTLVPPLGAAPDAPPYYGDGANQPRFLYDDMKNGRVLQWNFFLEKKLGRDYLVSAGYNGNRAYNLQYGRISVNSPQFFPDSVTSDWRRSYIATNGRDPSADQVANPFQTDPNALIPYAGEFGRRTVNRRSLLNPYTLFPNNLTGAPIGYSNYHALMLQVNKNFSSGLQFNAHYTWSKAMFFGGSEAETNNYGENGGLANGNVDRRNFRNSFFLSPNDIPHRFVMTAVYELPFGRGKSMLSENRFLDALVGGWQVAPVVLIQAGQPQSISGGNGLNGLPNRIDGAPIEVPKELQRWYDSPNTADRTVTLPSGRQIVVCRFCFLKYSSDAFQHNVVQFPNGSFGQDIFWFGGAARLYDDFRSPSRWNVNFSATKNWSVRERFQFTLSAEATNLFNNAQFRPTSLAGGVGGAIIAPNAARRERPGQVQNANFGTYGLAFFDPRQIEMRLRVRF